MDTPPPSCCRMCGWPSVTKDALLHHLKSRGCWRCSRNQCIGNSSDLTSGQWASSEWTASDWTSRDWASSKWASSDWTSWEWNCSAWNLMKWSSSEWGSSQWTPKEWQCPGSPEARDPDLDPAAVPGAWAEALVVAFEGTDWGGLAASVGADASCQTTRDSVCVGAQPRWCCRCDSPIGEVEGDGAIDSDGGIVFHCEHCDRPAHFHGNGMTYCWRRRCSRTGLL